MDEDVTAAMEAAGDALAAAVRMELRARGLPDGLRVQVQDGRVVVGSSSRAVREAELGAVGAPPRASMELAARRAAPDAVERVAAALRRSLV